MRIAFILSAVFAVALLAYFVHPFVFDDTRTAELPGQDPVIDLDPGMDDPPETAEADIPEANALIEEDPLEEPEATLAEPLGDDLAAAPEMTEQGAVPLAGERTELDPAGPAAPQDQDPAGIAALDAADDDGSPPAGDQLEAALTVEGFDPDAVVAAIEASGLAIERKTELIGAVNEAADAEADLDTVLAEVRAALEG